MSQAEIADIIEELIPVLLKVSQHVIFISKHSNK